MTAPHQRGLQVTTLDTPLGRASDRMARKLDQAFRTELRCIERVTPGQANTAAITGLGLFLTRMRDRITAVNDRGAGVEFVDAMIASLTVTDAQIEDLIKADAMFRDRKGMN